MKGLHILPGSIFIFAILLNACNTAKVPPPKEFPVHVKTNPVLLLDLASDTEWTLSIDDGELRPIKVPGGGYNSDMQDPPHITHQPVVAHAYCMLHYVNYPKPAQMITGMGEFAWDWDLHEPYPGADGGIEEFIYYGGDMRLNDIAYFAGWCFINYWPNFSKE